MIEKGGLRCRQGYNGGLRQLMQELKVPYEHPATMLLFL